MMRIMDVCPMMRRYRSFKLYLSLIGVALIVIFLSSKDLSDNSKPLNKTKHKRIDIVSFRQSDINHRVDPRVKRVYMDDNENDNLDLNSDSHYHMEMAKFWKRVAGMSSPGHLYPTKVSMYSMSPSIPSILNTLASAKIDKACLFAQSDAKNVKKHYGNNTLYDYGSTHKWLLTLAGGQLAIFKPLWYPPSYTTDQWYEGFELANAEIASFHLDRILHFNKVPFTAGRSIHVEREILPVASPALLKAFWLSFTRNGDEWCLSARCYMCDDPVTVCTHLGILQGAVIYHVAHLGPSTGHPWDIQHYHKEVLHTNFSHRCQQLLTKHSIQHTQLLDLADLAVLDYLSYNFDSKVYKARLSRFSHLTVHLDRGRSFSTYQKEDDANLLILKQCCRLRPSTVQRLQSLQQQNLSELLQNAFLIDSLASHGILHHLHFPAINMRLQKLLDVIERCHL